MNRYLLYLCGYIGPAPSEAIHIVSIEVLVLLLGSSCACSQPSQTNPEILIEQRRVRPAHLVWSKAMMFGYLFFSWLSGFWLSWAVNSSRQDAALVVRRR